MIYKDKNNQRDRKAQSLEMQTSNYLTKNKLLQNLKVSIIEKIQKVRYYPITKNNNLTLTSAEIFQIIVVKKL
jgi:hypothetical protein